MVTNSELTARIGADQTAAATSSPFDAIRKTKADGTEYWEARELLMGHLGYVQWRNAETAVKRAMRACDNSGHSAADHFAEVRKMIPTGKGAERGVIDYHLSRYACYMVALNGDPEKAEVAAAQTYFCVRTREAEVARQLTPAEQLLASAQRLVDHERKIAQHDRQIEALEVQVREDGDEIRRLVAVQESARAERTRLPLSAQPAAPRDARANVSTILRNYTQRTVSDPAARDYGEPWRVLYREFRDRHHIDLKVRAENSGRKPLDIAEELGKMEELWALASELFG